MALSTIAVPPDPRRDARARELAPLVGSWPKHTLKVAWGSFEAGTTFRRAYGSTGARYLVNSVACECPDYQQSHNICKHVRAVVLWEAGQQPAPRTRYEALVPACKTPGCTDIAEARDGFCDRCASD